ncbi:nuclear transport factor 2 family protein [Streptomyces niveus]|uniref:nuclear transport factor 2 family protein n=1 Tax=Streptomyces niveus TaxID=193462 RepID=UPI003446067E
MEQRSRRGFVTLAAATGGLLVAGTPAEAIPRHGRSLATPHGSDRERVNKAIVRRAFARQNSGGSFYEILDEHVVWTVVNGRTYDSRQEFLEEGSAPILTRLATHLHMTPQDLWADGDTVVARFEGDATALDGLPYHNEYCWVLTFRRDAVVRAHAYLDMVAVTELIERVEAPR